MRIWITQRFTSAGRALVVLPDLQGCLTCLLIAVVTLAATGVLAVGSGLVHLVPRHGNAFLTLAIAVLFPALPEELFFRGLLIPSRDETRHGAVAIIGSTLAFVAWHPVGGALFPGPLSPTFSHPAFLAAAGLLGLAAAFMRYSTGSLWPAIGLHGLAVWGWSQWFGGPLHL